MKWSEFVKIGESASDGEFYEKLYLYDNFPILWKADSEECLVKTLLESGRYKRHSFENDVDSLHSLKGGSLLPRLPNLKIRYQKRLAYAPGTIVIKHEKGEIFCTRTNDNIEARRVSDFQRSYFNQAIMLHTDQIKKADVNGFKALFAVTKDIGETVFIPREIPFCLPRVFNYKNGQDQQDYSTIVYWPDSVEEEMCRK